MFNFNSSIVKIKVESLKKVINRLENISTIDSNGYVIAEVGVGSLLGLVILVGVIIIFLRFKKIKFCFKNFDSLQNLVKSDNENLNCVFDMKESGSKNSDKTLDLSFKREDSLLNSTKNIQEFNTQPMFQPFTVKNENFNPFYSKAMDTTFSKNTSNNNFEIIKENNIIVKNEAITNTKIIENFNAKSSNQHHSAANTEQISSKASNSSSHKCNSCPYVAKTLSQLHGHNKFHSIDKKRPFKCKYCNYYVQGLHSLPQHEKIHLTK